MRSWVPIFTGILVISPFVAFAIWRLRFPGRARIYWACCLALLVFGMGAMGFGFLSSEATGNPEMPLSFALGADMALLGMLGVAVPAIRMFL